jgi:hypothetical protein
VLSAGEGLERCGVSDGLVVVCLDGPGVGEGEGLPFGGSVPVEVWCSSSSLGRYGVDRVVVEMLRGRGYEWVVFQDAVMEDLTELRVMV